MSNENKTALKAEEIEIRNAICFAHTNTITLDEAYKKVSGILTLQTESKDKEIEEKDKLMIGLERTCTRAQDICESQQKEIEELKTEIKSILEAVASADDLYLNLKFEGEETPYIKMTKQIESQSKRIKDLESQLILEKKKVELNYAIAVKLEKELESRGNDL